MELRLFTAFGSDIGKHIPDIAKMRIRAFRSFPYLYDGNFDYEQHYLACYSSEEHAMLAGFASDDDIVAMSTALPLQSSTEILDGCHTMFEQLGLKSSDYFYYGEVIVEPEFRGRGLARVLYQEHERFAKKLGYSGACIATVIRDSHHPLRPSDYQDSDGVWIQLGFRRLPIHFEFTWPTLVDEERSEEQSNQMGFWLKDFQ